MFNLHQTISQLVSSSGVSSFRTASKESGKISEFLISGVNHIKLNRNLFVLNSETCFWIPVVMLPTINLFISISTQIPKNVVNYFRDEFVAINADDAGVGCWHDRRVFYGIKAGIDTLLLLTYGIPPYSGTLVAILQG